MDYTNQNEQKYSEIQTLILELLLNSLNGNIHTDYKSVYLEYLVNIIRNNSMMPSYLISIIGATMGASICVIQPGLEELVLTMGDNDPLTRARLSTFKTKKGRKQFPCDVFLYYNGGDEHSGGG